MNVDFIERYGPWALIAGASEGIGEAFARAVASRGLNLVLVARRESELRATADAIAEDCGVDVLPLVLDLGADDLLACVRAGVGEREIGLLIYNAAYAPLGSFFDQPLEAKLQVLAVNCRGPLILTHEYAGAMRARGRGGVILMGSLAGMQGAPKLTTYAASKAFDLVLAEGLWAELRDEGVDVLACVAGATRTPGFEQNASAASGPVMEPSQVAEEALATLGWQPSLIPGVANRLANLVMSRLPRRSRVQIMRAALGE